MRWLFLMFIAFFSLHDSNAYREYGGRHDRRPHYGKRWHHRGPIIVTPGVPIVRPFCKRHPFHPQCPLTPPRPKIAVPMHPPTMTTPPSALVVPGLPHMAPPSTVMPSVPGGTSVPPTPIFR